MLDPPDSKLYSPVSHSLTQTQRTNSAQTQTRSITLKDAIILLGVCYVQ